MTATFRHKDLLLVHGDCLEVLPKVTNQSVDMVLADLPYGITACKWDAVIPFDKMWEMFWACLKQSGIVCLTAAQPFSSALVMSQPDYFRHEWVWIKNRGSNFANTVREPMKEHEQVLVFSRGKWAYNKQMQERTGAGAARVDYDFKMQTKTENYGKFAGQVGVSLPKTRVPSSWQKFNTATGKEKTKHPTQKPVALMEYLIRTYTNEGDLVVDPCMGSGTTGMACAALNRKFIGIEKEEEYYDISVGRIRSLGDAHND